MYLISGLSCVDPIEAVLYSSPKLKILPNVCCWCEMEVCPENGLGDFETYNSLNQGRNVLPC